MTKPFNKILFILLILQNILFPITATDDTRLKVLYAMKAGRDAYDTYDKYSNSKSSSGGSGSNSFTVKVGYSNSSQGSETISNSVTAQGSTIQAGGDVSVKAVGNPNADKGDINVTGSGISGQNVTLDATRDINLASAENSHSSNTRTSSNHFSAGITYQGGTAVGLYAEGAKGRGRENEANVTHTETTITAADTLNIKSGQDTNLKGAIAKGDTINAHIGRNLNIESQQDTAAYTSRQENISGSVQISYGGDSGASASYMYAKTNADHKSVKEQSGLFAGTGGYNINTGNNTDLKGAVIASDATPDKNTLTSKTITFSDINNKSEYSASSLGISGGASYSGGGGGNSGNNAGNKGGNGAGDSSGSGSLPLSLGIPSSDSASGTTRSAVAAGAINTSSDTASLSRDTKTANGAVSNVFNKQEVADNQEASRLISEQAFKLVGDLAKIRTKPYTDAQRRYETAEKEAEAANESGDSEQLARAEAAMQAAQADMAANQEAYDTWKDGSLAKIALHAAVGGLASAIGKGDIASGALGAAANEAAIPYMAQALQNAGLDEKSEEYKSLLKIGSTIAGSAIGAATSGNGNGAMTGGATALSGTTNNFLKHKFFRDTP
ncbi:MAG TPA: hemagglutinin repeat-containing protein [Deltaproteobacteria bacterium]|nr:hemagglutinin repeat-containing protein [Deltaproteobacteria bacterium]HQB37663.1 hemagglutinin repeat-containing protein [Deltaproteobacteria bacterium]